jgi:hypothetical protein
MEVVGPYKMLATAYMTAQCRNSEDHNLNPQFIFFLEGDRSSFTPIQNNR